HEGAYLGLQYREQTGPVQIEGRKLSGYAAVFNEVSHRTPFGPERIHPQAFSQDPFDNVVALYNHDKNIVLGSVRSGTLKVWTDQKGLRYEIDPLPETRADVREAISRRDVWGSSFGFLPRLDQVKWEKVPPHGDIATIMRAQVLDLGPVLRPAYSGTTAEVRQFNARAEALKLRYPPGYLERGA
ncbi:MAG: hypothetical protein GEU81_17465, partial [Nitriliruptorales bacterium]|nr:hypothetical protein [Nitriliruptorales bacterium]